MPRKSTKKTPKPVRPQLGDGVEILNASSVLEDPITRTLEVNYMPCLLYTSPSPRDMRRSRMPSSA